MGTFYRQQELSKSKSTTSMFSSFFVSSIKMSFPLGDDIHVVLCGLVEWC